MSSAGKFTSQFPVSSNSFTNSVFAAIYGGDKGFPALCVYIRSMIQQQLE